MIFHKAQARSVSSRTAETNTTLLDTHEYSTRVPSDITVADYAGCTRLGTMLLAHTTAHASAPQRPTSKTCMALSHRTRCAMTLCDMHPDFPRFISECKTPHSGCLAFILKNAIRLMHSLDTTVPDWQFSRHSRRHPLNAN